MVDTIYEISLKKLCGERVVGNERYLVDQILFIAEELGMLPPSVEGAKHWDDDNYWEPEDE